ncbi:MAG TPA: ATP-dependent DNA helicase RecQ [Gemmatimonadales bacterium]
MGDVASGLQRACTALHQHFGFQEFRPAQRRVVASVLAGRHVLAVLPTGGGKSVCFQIPALLQPGLTIVISPLISLMQDQVEAARRRGLPAAFVNSSLDPTTQHETLARVGSGATRLLYVAPERLPRLARELGEAGVRPALLAVDEAHCISEWGHDFRPAYRRIAEALGPLGAPQVVALTGSATPAVRNDICRSLAPMARFTVHLASFDRPNLWFGVEVVKDDRERVRRLFDLMTRGDGSAIVYAATRNTCEALARVLRHGGHRAAPYHAGLSPERRRDTLRQFLDGELPVVAATCAFGMGIDKPDVRHVIHWTLPATPESYYQEAGRAGRDGNPARCTLLFHPEDAAIHRLQLGVTFPPEVTVERAWREPPFRQALPSGVQASVARLAAELQRGGGRVCWAGVRRRRAEALARLAALEAYARGPGCRRRRLIGWFGERLQACAGCDQCQR